MYFMYVDESGDVGLVNSPSQYFVLTGLVVHELRWQPYHAQFVEFRRRMKGAFGLKLREEIHASALINSPGPLVRIKKLDRLTILRAMVGELAAMTDLTIINVVVDKQGKGADYEVFRMAWKALIQRFENTMSYRNFNGPANSDDRGMLFPDHTDDKKLTAMLREMRHYNPVPHSLNYRPGEYRNLALAKIVEDPNFRDSLHSYFIQACDVVAYLLYQKFTPNAFMRRTGAYKYFDRLDPILCKKASAADPQGIVKF